MQASVFEIKRFAVHDGDGIRTTVFLKGCPLRCRWCHNPESFSARSELAFYPSKCAACGECASVCPSGAHSMEKGVHVFSREKCIACGKCEGVCPQNALKLYGRKMSSEELLPLLLEDRDFYESTSGGVTVSGGECLLYPDFCAELLSKLKAEGINTAVDTCGDVPREAIDKVMPYTDTFLYDLKAASSEVHEKCTGRGNERILENLFYIDSAGKAIEVRIPYVPDFIDFEKEGMANILLGLKNLVRVRVLPYHSYAGSKYESLGMENRLPKRMPSTSEVKAFAEYLCTLGINAE